jgi:hypothetical protein
VLSCYRHEPAHDRIADSPSVAASLPALRAKRWFTAALQCDLTNVVTSHWLAKARGWR